MPHKPWPLLSCLGATPPGQRHVIHSAYVTDSVNPVLYRLAPTSTGQYELQEFLKFEGTPLTYVSAPGAEGINVNGIIC